MVIVRLIGGLGNQLFQYAVGRHLSRILGCDLKVDASAFEKYKLHAYALGHFNVRQVLATDIEIKAFTHSPIECVRKTLWRLGIGRSAGAHVRETEPFVFAPDVLRIKHGVYLDGFWQSYKYFEDIAPIIRREYTIKSPPEPLNIQALSKITSVSSVSLHVRRGDYVSNSKTLSTHGLLPLEYYDCALNVIASRVKSPHVFVFSDDIEWVKQNLGITIPHTYIEHNLGVKGFEDLRLMSNCSHHIIANSSFSWWAAWLSANPHKTVVAPRKWLASKEVISDDLFPKEWILL